MRTPSKILLILPALFLFLASGASAAELYLTPGEGRYQPGETVTVDVRLDNQEECVNAAEVNIGYPKDTLEAVDVSTGNSIFSIWVVRPVIRHEYGLITFIGGIPGGYCGRIPGDPAVTNTLAKLVFRFSDKIPGTVPQDIPVNILDSSKVVLHNGQGTEAKLSVRSAKFSVLESGMPQRNEWTDALKGDRTPPEVFALTIHRDDAIFDNKYFAAWSTVDKQTGIDRYEVAEVPNVKNREPGALAYKRADSPYVLTDQSLKSIVIVKAYDKAGNVRVAQYTPAASQSRTNMLILWTLASLGVIFFALMRFTRFLPW